MGDKSFKVVPADMTHDQGQWNAASEALGRAVSKAKAADTVAFGSFAPLVKSIFTTAADTARDNLKAGESATAGMATNLANNNGQYGKNDSDADRKVRGAGARSGSESSSDAGHADKGGKDKDHYAELMGPPKPTDPKDPEITFDRHVDPKTGEVTWTPREMKPGEATAIDGRDVERIPQRAERVVVRMVDGEPQITFVDSAPEGKEWESTGEPDADLRKPGELASQESTQARVVPGSGAAEPGPHLQPQDEFSRRLPEGADYAVVEVRDGEPHLVFLDVEGGEVHQIADHGLDAQPEVFHSAPQQTQEA